MHSWKGLGADGRMNWQTNKHIEPSIGNNPAEFRINELHSTKFIHYEDCTFHGIGHAWTVIEQA